MNELEARRKFESFKQKAEKLIFYCAEVENLISVSHSEKRFELSENQAL